MTIAYRGHGFFEASIFFLYFISDDLDRPGEEGDVMCNPLTSRGHFLDELYPFISYYKPNCTAAALITFNLVQLSMFPSGPKKYV